MTLTLALQSSPRVEPCANVIRSAAAHRSILVGGGAPKVQKIGGYCGAARRGRWSSLISHTCLKSVFQKRTSVIKVCMLNNYFLRLSGLFRKSIIKQAFSNKRLQNQAGWSSDSKIKYQQQLYADNSRCRNRLQFFNLLQIEWRWCELTSPPGDYKSDAALVADVHFPELLEILFIWRKWLVFYFCLCVYFDCKEHAVNCARSLNRSIHAVLHIVQWAKDASVMIVISRPIVINLEL